MLYLYKHFLLRDGCISKLQTALRNKPSFLLSSTRAIIVRQVTKPLSTLFTISHLRHLEGLTVYNLDLTKEHSVITRGPLSRSVTKLILSGLRSCPVSNLLRFLNSFLSLTDLSLFFNPSTSLSDSGQILPRPRSIPARSLKELRLRVLPGVDRLIEWYVLERCFLASLRGLRIEWWFNPPMTKHYPRLIAPVALLGHCADTLEELTLSTTLSEGPIVDEISSTGTFFYTYGSAHTDDTCSGTVIVAELTQNRVGDLQYWSFRDRSPAPSFNPCTLQNCGCCFRCWQA